MKTFGTSSYPRTCPSRKGSSSACTRFQKIDTDIGLLSLLEEMEVVPPTDLALSEEAETKLPQVAGGVSVALARTIRILDPGLKAPHSKDWEEAFGVMDLLI